MIAAGTAFSKRCIRDVIGGVHNGIVLIVSRTRGFNTRGLDAALVSGVGCQLTLSTAVSERNSPRKAEGLCRCFKRGYVRCSLGSTVSGGVLAPCCCRPIIISLDRSRLDRCLSLATGVGGGIRTSGRNGIVLDRCTGVLLVGHTQLISKTIRGVSILHSLVRGFGSSGRVLICYKTAAVRSISCGRKRTRTRSVHRVSLITSVLKGSLNVHMSGFASRRSTTREREVGTSFSSNSRLRTIITVHYLSRNIGVPDVGATFVLTDDAGPGRCMRQQNEILQLCGKGGFTMVCSFVALPFTLSTVRRVSSRALRNKRSLTGERVVEVGSFTSVTRGPFSSSRLVTEVRDTCKVRFSGRSRRIRSCIW